MKSEKIATALVRHLLTTTAVANFSLFTYHFSLFPFIRHRKHHSTAPVGYDVPHPTGAMRRTRRVRQSGDERTEKRVSPSGNC